MSCSTGRDTPANESLDDLRDTVHDLAGQVQILCEVLDEFREHIRWAVTNDKLVVQIRRRLSPRLL